MISDFDNHPSPRPKPAINDETPVPLGTRPFQVHKHRCLTVADFDVEMLVIAVMGCKSGDLPARDITAIEAGRRIGDRVAVAHPHRLNSGKP